MPRYSSAAPRSSPSSAAARADQYRQRGLHGVADTIRRRSAEEIEAIRQIGDNTGCMALKGASRRHEGQEPRADEWPMREDLQPVADRWHITPALVP